ncbi:hypothetical protein V6N12_053937 [Hibiscus sabdariffa]|uniref:Fe2OG dioxygenase domain-containing protein n=1 Tax=Hibiscus sabdariffa TaxID=183260 RepID=A0ABR2D919_9ROSI
MEKLVSNWFNDQALPQSYIFPPETRPGNHTIPGCSTIPVVDLSKASGLDRTGIVQQILKASREFGFFQRTRPASTPRIRNDLAGFKQVVQTMKRKRLGLSSGFFGDKLSESVLLSVNHYPPCPDPSLTLGVSRHCDPNLLTILHQGDVSGLQVYRDGEWIGVEPLHNAFVVNIGHQLQIISNNKLKSAEHRAVTNSEVARTTAAFFIYPSDDCIIEPVKSLIDTDESPAYRAFRFKEFQLNYVSRIGNPEESLEPFKLHV